jgi:hypothetical protein
MAYKVIMFFRKGTTQVTKLDYLTDDGALECAKFIELVMREKIGEHEIKGVCKSFVLYSDGIELWRKDYAL